MPWTVGDVDRHKKGLTPAQKSKWVKIANSALKRCQSKGGSNCDASAIRIANSQMSDDCFDCTFTEEEILQREWTEEDARNHDEFFEYFVPEEEQAFQKSDKEKPGGSNAGEYKKGPFCGPSGGAPKGTYPVNTRGRARAALAYARHAPNPAGIKKCVCRHWSDLPSCKTKKTSMEVETMTEKRKVPEAALHFMDHDCFAKAVGEEGAKSRLSMIAYSGKPIKNHWYWGDLTIDLDGMKFEKRTFPILENHRTERKIAFSKGKPVIENYQLKANPDKVEFVDTDAANEFIKLSGQGFPYESSIYGVPSTIERLEEGATAEVNGFTMKGPGAIWRQWTFKEMSVCVFGHDSNTRSSAFSKEEIELDLEEKKVSIVVHDDDEDLTGKEVTANMTLEEMKKENPEAYEKLMEEAKAEVTPSITEEVEAKFNKEKEDLENKHNEEKGGMTERILELEKRDAIRTEAELKHHADGIWAHKLSESNIPEHLFAKVSAHVVYSKFVKEGSLDEKAFGEAIDAEIKDWEEKGVTSSVLGMSFQQRKETGDDDTDATQFDKENEEAVDTLCKFAGIQTSAS